MGSDAPFLIKNKKRGLTPFCILGAGDGDRTHVSSLEGLCSTTELLPPTFESGIPHGETSAGRPAFINYDLWSPKDDISHSAEFTPPRVEKIIAENFPTSSRRSNNQFNTITTA